MTAIGSIEAGSKREPAPRSRGERLLAIILCERMREGAAKLGIAGACLFLCLGAAVRLSLILDGMGAGFDALATARLCAVLCQTVFYLLIGWFTLTRRPALKRARGWQPRAVAAFGTFSIFAFGFLPPVQGLAIAWHVVAALLLLFSAALGALVLTRLGRSVSVMPEARGLVTKGPYRVVRHPLYLVEEFAAIAGFIEAMSLGAALLLVAQIACQLRRIANEESVLAAAFPDYARYQATSWRVLPGIW